MAFDFFAVASNGSYPTPTPPTDSQRMAYAASYGLLSVLSSIAPPSGLFTAGQYLIRQPWSENYLLAGTTLITRLPWSENYEFPTGEKLIRQPWGEDYKEGAEQYNRLPNSENYESDDFIFTRQPDSENYIVEAK